MYRLATCHTQAMLTVMCLLGWTSVQAYAGELRGRVTDRQTGAVVSGVVVRLQSTRLGGITDTSGRFVIGNVDKGQYTLSASRIGYSPTQIHVSVSQENEDVVFTMLQSDVVSQDVIVSANRRIQAVQDVPLSVSTVSQEDLSQRNITMLDDALRYVSGVAVVKDQVNIRGSSGFALGVGNRTMVLLDGFPLMSGDNGDIKFDVLPVSDVDRIEVIKGAGSALYGTGALGGVVSMISKPVLKDHETSMRGYFGAYTSPRYPLWDYTTSYPLTGGFDMRTTHRFDNFSVTASGGIRRDRSYRQFDENMRGVVYTKGQWRPNDHHQLTVFGLYAIQSSQNFLYWKDLQYATFPPDDQDTNQTLKSEKLAACLEWQWLINSSTSLVVRPGLFRTEFGNTINNVEQDSNSSTAYAWNVDALLTTTMSPLLTFTAGATERINTVSADIYGEQLQTIGSLFAQGEFTVPRGPIFTLGLRMDHEHTASLTPYLEFSPKAGMSWSVSPEVSWRASAGRGFRAPAIAERYASIRYGSFQVKPNPNLSAESSWSFETGVHWTPTNAFIPLDVDLAVFDNELYNLIEPRFDVNDPSVPIVFLNITRARIIGSELTIRAALHKMLKVETGLTAMLPRDLVLDQTLKYRNNILWYSRVIVTPVEPLSIQMDYRFQNRVENIDDNLQVFIPDADQRVPSHVVDLRVFWTEQASGSSAVRFGLICKNLMDYYYAEAVANLSPTRSILFQIEYQ